MLLTVLILYLGTERPLLKDCNKHVVPWWAPQWRQLGIELDMDHCMMDIIEYNHPNDCERCCLEMLVGWLDKFPTASWEDLIFAVDNLLSFGMCVVHVDFWYVCSIICTSVMSIH